MAETIGRVRAAGAAGPLTLRADSGFYTRTVVGVCQRHQVRFSITAKLTKAVRKAIEAIPETAWTPIPYWLEGGADVAETRYRPFGKTGPLVRLIVRRVRPTPGSQLALFTNYDYHPFITDRQGSTLELEADHRRHAEVEPAICDLKHGAGLEHLPSGRFAANAVWLALCGLAANLARWTRPARRGRAAYEPQDPAGALFGAARPADGVGPPTHPAPAPLVAVAVALGVRAGPAALHPPPDLTARACGRPDTTEQSHGPGGSLPGNQ